MATKEEVKKLAALARVNVEEGELASFTKEFDAILAYVGQLDALTLPKDLADTKPPLRNIFREDTSPTPSGTYTKRIVEAFPEKEGDYLVVKQIITHD